MEFYNRIMTYVWLIAGIAIFIVSTYMSITDDIKKWGFYYIFSLVAFMMFFMKRWMVKRMQKHIQFLEDQKKSAQ
ncbi:MAG: hypothetical protein ACK50Y_11210 [Flavobacteriia bacterium]|jgi:hypothetical protein